MVSRKTVCLRRLGGNRPGELRAGRFFANPKGLLINNRITV